MSSELLLRLQFRELGLRFLDSYNPKLDKSIVVADAILSYDGPIETNRPVRHLAHEFVQECVEIIEGKSYDGPIETNRPVRHLAHEFVQECVEIIEGKSICLNNKDFHEWITVWNREFGIDYTGV